MTELGLFEKELKKVPWYITLYTDIKFWWIDLKHKIQNDNL